MDKEQALQEFNSYYAQGMNCMHAGLLDPYALGAFHNADSIAIENNMPEKRLDALQPRARVQWQLARYKEAAESLNTAQQIARELELNDQQGIILSNMARLTVAKTMDKPDGIEQIADLRTEALPKFLQAYNMLRGNTHTYFTYANATHGAVVAAFAGDKPLAKQLITEGMSVALRKPAPEYGNTRPAFEGKRTGIVRLLAATALMPLGYKTPILATIVRNRLLI